MNEVPKKSIIYDDAMRKAHMYLNELKRIADDNDASSNQTVAASSIDIATELQRFFDLKERGVITEDEYNAKKAQLLAM